jgi:hypothetical protein
VKSFARSFFILILLAGFACALRADNCAICGDPIYGPEYLVTDKVTGEQLLVCSNCIKLPRCFICGLPVKDGVELPDGRWLCARDAKVAVLDADDIEQTYDEVHDDLDRLFSRFTEFPTNVDVSVIDRIDVNSMFNTMGNAFESPDLLGYTQPVMSENQKRYKIALLTGQPVAELREVCAHELSHAWVGENVSPQRHARIARDAEEGFCEMVGYLLMDSQGEEAEKKRVLANAYTRGQVRLFIEAEQRYGFDQILDWMKYGETSKLDKDNLDEIRDVKIPAATPFAENFSGGNDGAAAASAPEPAKIELQSVLWSGNPIAIINGRSFFLNDEASVKFDGTNATIRCLEIRQNFVRIQNLDSGGEQKLFLPK